MVSCCGAVMLVGYNTEHAVQLGKNSEAADDSSKAIELDPTYVKAYIRRGTACMALQVCALMIVVVVLVLMIT